jgi:hypothetical protein
MDSLGNIATSRDHCCIYVCTEESNTGIVATTGIEEIIFSNQIIRLIKT